MKILFVVPYPQGQAPSQRFRFEQYLDLLGAKGWEYRFSSFIDAHTWRILYKPGHLFQKAAGILRGFINRFFLLLSVPFYDFIFIHREATPIGPPWFEWVVAKILRKRIIYDFDDAIWIPNTSANNKMVAGIKWHHKVASICRWAYKISCGNAYLQAYASQFNGNAIVNPTTIDTCGLHNEVKEQNTEKVIIGWTGTHSTMKYIDPLVPVLKQLEKQYDFTFCVISNQQPTYDLKSLEYRPWRKETEIADLLDFNVGVMPLEDDLWAKGKCAFKALQYMALGIPALVSPVGMNTEVVVQGKNGYICNSPASWYEALEEVISNAGLRTSLGQEARRTIEALYSVNANRNNFFRLFS